MPSPFWTKKNTGPTPSPISEAEDVNSDRDAASSTTPLNKDVKHSDHFLIAGPCELCH